MSHAKLSPSSADRWYHCPASMIPDVPVRDDSNKFAARGTALHSIGEKMLTGQDVTTEDITSKVSGFDIALDYDDLSQAEQYVQYVTSGRVPGDLLIVEEKLSMTSFIPNGFGTADAQLIDPLNSVEVIDAKFGSGNKIMADSLQIIIYMIASWDKYGADLMLEYAQGTIVQPPFDHVDSITLYPQQIEEWREKIRTRAKYAELAGTIDPFNKRLISATEHVPGDWCKYCPRKLTCMALRSQASAAIESDFNELAEPDDLATMKAMVKPLEEWIKAVNGEVSDRLKHGKSVPGWKLVAGRRSRSWTDEDEIEAYLRTMKIKVSEIFDTKMKSVAQMEKLLKGNDSVVIDEYVTLSPGRPTIAPEKDKRQAIASAATLDFDDIPIQENTT